jgi:purine-binding chemotaxis protein CheW
MAIRGSAESLRQAFDAQFARRPDGDTVDHDELAAIRVGDLRCALRLAEIAGLFADRPVTPLPSAVPELLGVAAVRDAVFPVFDLGRLLGRPGAGSPRWLVLTTAEPTVALAFDAYDGQLHVPASAVAAADGDGPAHTSEVVHQGGVLRPVISIASIHEALKGRLVPTSRET